LLTFVVVCLQSSTAITMQISSKYPDFIFLLFALGIECIDILGD